MLSLPQDDTLCLTVPLAPVGHVAGAAETSSPMALNARLRAERSSQEPWKVTEGKEHYCFGVLEVSLQLQFAGWIVGVLEWMQRDQGEGCCDFPGERWG